MTSDTNPVVDDLDPTTEETNGRRDLLRKVALGGAAAAVATVALDRTASAADGDPINIGEDNVGTLPTTLVTTPAAAIGAAAPSALSVGAATADLATAPFPAQIGGYGGDDYAIGLHGSTSNKAGLGVVAANLGAIATDTEAPPTGLAVASVYGPQIKFVLVPTPEGATPAYPVTGPTAGKHGPGELYVDKDYTLWYTVQIPVPAGSPSGTEPGVRFVKLAGASTAGSFHALPVAKRVFDSRETTSKAKIAEGTSVDIDLTKDTAGAASGYPAGARLAVVNLTITDTEGGGFVVLFAKGTPIADVKTSNINWTAAATSIANSTSVPVDATGSITARVGGDTTDTLTARSHVIVDLVGYYL